MRRSGSEAWISQWTTRFGMAAPSEGVYRRYDPPPTATLLMEKAGAAALRSGDAIRPDDPARAPLVRGGADVARGRAAGLRPCVELRPRDVGWPARVAVVRCGADARRGGSRHRPDRPRHLRVLAQQPPPGAAHALGAGPP